MRMYSSVIFCPELSFRLSAVSIECLLTLILALDDCLFKRLSHVLVVEVKVVVFFFSHSMCHHFLVFHMEVKHMAPLALFFPLIQFYG